MSNQLGVTVGGVHRTGSTAYLTVDGIHRKALKMYKTIGGVHRLCYEAGVKWLKYSCDVNLVPYTRYKEGDWVLDNQNDYFEAGVIAVLDFSLSYSFDVNTGKFALGKLYSLMPEDLENAYHMSSTNNSRLYKYADQVADYDTDGNILGYYYNYYYKDAEEVTEYYQTYSKGATSYGSVYAEEGSWPEDGIVITHNDNYCIIQIGDTYYYYEKT